MDDPTPKRIDGRARTVRELMDGAKYTIDFYQREYAWQERQVRELIDDLTGKFLDFYSPDHDPEEVERYGHYFLGPIVISHKRGERFIVDGQQRLTTLTLLCIHLHHQLDDAQEKADVLKLVYSTRRRRKSFNLDVPERQPVMMALVNDEAIDTDGMNESCVNIEARYQDIVSHFPDELAGDALAYFVFWLMDNVHLVEIEAYSDEDAYTIFETMNDRGLSLSLPEMLKGYVLANIRHESSQRRVNTLWKQHVQALKDLGPEEEVDFFKNWLRARYANTFQSKARGERSKDYERIGSEFHRWVRDQREPLGLKASESFVRWVTRDLDFYARQTLLIRRAARSLTDGLESIRYNDERAFTQQTQLLLAALDPSDSSETIRQKLRLVADFVDIWLARRAWCYRTTAQRNTKSEVFQLTRALRGRSVGELSTLLRERLDSQDERFVNQPDFRLHKQNYRQVRHILARLTLWLDHQCGLPSHFDDLVSKGKSKRFEIEHIWANHYDRFSEVFEHSADFDLERNRIGGLLLLQRGVNQSLGDATYEAKRDAYVSKGQNLLARSLHPFSYQNNPAFVQLVERTGLQFRAHETFRPEDQAERQLLYLRIAEWVWNPSRLDLDGERPPEHEPLKRTVAPTTKRAPADADAEPRRYQERRAFWTRLLAYAATQTDLHARCSPTLDSWVGAGAGRSGLGFNYGVLKDQTRAELYINTGSREQNKALFDRLAERRPAIEESYGGSLDWQRLDDKKTCRICVTLSKGGWRDRQTWDAAIPVTVEAMIRLNRAIRPVLDALGTSG